MGRSATYVLLSPDEEHTLRNWIAKAADLQSLAERAKIVLFAAEGQTTMQIARTLGIRPARVSKWRMRFSALGVGGLATAERPGKPRRYDDSVEHRVLSMIQQSPPPPHPAWTGPLLAQAVGDVSTDHVWRILRAYGISFRKQGSSGYRTGSTLVIQPACILGLHMSRTGSIFAVGTLDPACHPASRPLQTYFRLPNARAASALKLRFPDRLPTLLDLLHWASERQPAHRSEEAASRTVESFVSDALTFSGEGWIHVYIHGDVTAAPAGICQHVFATFDLWRDELVVWLSMCLAGGIGDPELSPALLGAVDRLRSSGFAQDPFEWCTWRVALRQRTQTGRLSQ